MNNKKRKMLLLSMLIILVMGVGATVAFLHTSTSDVENTFDPTQVSCDVNETFDNKVKTNVSVTNTSDIPAFIRAEVVVTWQDSEGNVYAEAPVEGTDYTMSYGGTEGTLTNSGWVEGADGFYYHTNPVAVGEDTAIFIAKCEPVDANTPEGYSLHVEVLASAIQVEGVSDGVPTDPTGAEGRSPAAIAWTGDIVTVTVVAGEGGIKTLSVSPLAE